MMEDFKMRVMDADQKAAAALFKVAEVMGEMRSVAEKQTSSKGG